MGKELQEKLHVDKDLVARCRKASRLIADGIQVHINRNTTSSVERTVARFLGVDGVDDEGTPLPNILVDNVKKSGRLGRGIFYWIGNAVLHTGKNPADIARMVQKGQLKPSELEERPEEEVRRVMEPYVATTLSHIQAQRDTRRAELQEKPSGPEPWLYVIVATGNIYEDVFQAQSAAESGADAIAVIRSTAQSLLDYVPYGPTTEGFGGTYATQENFRIMRQALDETARKTGRYVRLVNYASGLAMPEISAMGAVERLDMMLNDAMYGILFRDINMKRTFIDQYFSRMINAYAEIIINTGEDNYLTTADAVEEAHTVMASQFINEELARRSGLPPRLMGLGHAFEMNPDIEDGFLMEVAQAQLVRQLFPEAPIKYMPPTKYMTGNIFRGYLMDGMFNLASVLTGQSIQLLGMLTEAIHTPFLHDRTLAIQNARYVFNNARHLGEEIEFRKDGRIQKRADDVLLETTRMLEDISEKGLMDSITRGVFANISRTPEGGKGADGVIEKEPNYLNPFLEIFKKELNAV